MSHSFSSLLLIKMMAHVRQLGGLISRAARAGLVRRPFTRFAIAFLAVAMLATASVWTRGRSASNSFHWPAALARIFATPNARTGSSPLPVDTTGDYRSAAVTGDWNNIATWETFDGSTWIAATVPPTSTDGVITILSGHTVTVTASVNADQVIINLGGALTVNSGVTLTIDEGTGTDLTDDGTVQVDDTGVIAGAGSVVVNGTLGVGSASATDAVAANVTASLTLNSGSTVNFNGAGAQTVGARNYYNLTISGARGNATVTMASGTVGIAGLFDPSATAVTYSVVGNTVEYNGSALFTGPLPSAFNPYNNLTLNTGLGNTVAGFAGLKVDGTLEVKSGTFASASDYTDVLIDSGATLDLSSPITVSGNWTNNGTFNPNTFTVTFDGAGAQTITTGGATSGKVFAGFTIDKSGGTAALAGNLGATALNVTAGTFDQGASFDVSTGSVNVGATGIWNNLGTGDLTLSGGVVNGGTITLNSNGATCGDADSILIRSSDSASITPTQRSWSGGGTFSLVDVDVKDQGGAAIIAVHSGTNSGGNGVTWVFINSCAGAGGQLYRWVGPVGNDSWTNAVNWQSNSGDPRTTPNASDVLVFDGFTPTVSNVAVPNLNPETIAALRVINGAFPSFSTTGTPTLTIDSGAGGLGFNVNNLSITGSNALTIKLASGTLGDVSGIITVADGGHRLVGSAAGAITFQSSSIFSTLAGFTGNAFGDGSVGNGAAGSIVFASGSSYIKNAGDSPFGTAGNASVVTFQTGSTAQWLTTLGFQASGRTYANLVIGNPTTATSVSDSGAGTFQFDSLTLNNSPTVDSSFTFTGSSTGAVNIRGNIQSTGVGIGASATIANVTIQSGSGGIQIAKPGDGTITFNNTDNVRYVLFQSDAAVASGTTLALGRVLQMGFPSADGILTVNGDLTPNVGAPGYVIGNVKKTFATAGTKTFEVGSPNGYSPVSANATAGTFPADFMVTAHQGQLPIIHGSGVNALQRYWTLTATGITANLTFNYLAGAPPSGDIVGTPASYVFFRDSGGTLTSFAPAGAPTSTSATINGVTSFSNWTLAEPAAVTPGTLQFVGAPYTDSETDTTHTKTITVSRSGGSDGAVDVTYTTSAGTATAGSDYVETTGTLHWNDADTGNKSFLITVNGDTTYEANETVNITLSNVTDTATITPPNPTTLTITNDDPVPANATLVVNTTDDNDFGACVLAHCSLREAINAANFSSDTSTIDFNIPVGMISGGVYTIQPTPTALPEITQRVTIDGASQTTFTGDTNVNGPEVVLNGSLLTGSPSGLYASSGATNTVIANLVINGFGSTGVVVWANNAQVLNNYIGTNAAGTAPVPNAGGMGVGASAGATSGYLISGNLISGNTGTGIGSCDVLSGTFSNNKIGTDRTGVSNVGNGLRGIHTFCTNFTNVTISNNIIAFNGSDGFRDEPDYFGGVPGNNHLNIRITQNSFFENGGLGINLLPPPDGFVDGVTANDSQDPDNGGNNLQNFPVITSSKVTGPTKTITGTLNTTPSSTSGYTIEFFSNTVCDGTNGEGKTYLGSVTTSTTNASGDVTPFTFHPGTLVVGDVITATATDVNGNTSEFSACFTTIAGTPGTLQFSAANYNTSETNADHVFTINVTRTGGTDGNVDVTFDTSNGTATLADNDYATNSGTLHWDEGDATNKTFDVTVKGDTTYEANETVNLTLSNPQGGVAIGSPNPATLTITNDDAIPLSLVVTKTADTDDGFCTLTDCSLREAISNANANADASTINFAIPGAGVQTISPTSALPTITQPVTINGYSQPLATANTLAASDNAVLLIELDGTSAGAISNGLNITGGASTIKGLIINRFGGVTSGFGIALHSNGHTISGNFLGTDATGLITRPNGNSGVFVNNGVSGVLIGGTTLADRNLISGNGFDGIDINGPGNTVQGNFIGVDATGATGLANLRFGVSVAGGGLNTIGGTTANTRNVISGNTSDGIVISGAASSINTIQGNYIGTNAVGTAGIANGGFGIEVNTGSSGNIIGGVAAGEANVIAFNGSDGVEIETGTGNAIRGNSIHDNGTTASHLGIDLSPDGVTANDDGAADDIDTGANNLQNFPVITAVVVGTPNTISGTLDSTPSQTFTIDFYSNPAGSCDPSGNGEGRTYLGSKSTTTDANGLGGFRFNPATLNVNDVVTATATDSAGNTSEFSACKTAVAIAFGQIKFAPANAPNTNDTETNSGTHVVNIVVQRVGGADRAVSVDYEITDGTATSEDYSAANGTLTWANGDATDRNIPITVKGDTKFELNETVSIKLVNAQGGATIAGDNPVTLTITNDDTQPTISINDVPQNEGNGPGTTNIAFTVSLSNASYLPITVDYATALGTTNPATVGTCGTAGVDYQTVAGTVSFAAGESSNNTTIQVPVCGDTTFEANETFFVNLSNANANATILDSQGVGTITNDDPLPTISIDNVTHNEGNFHGVDNNEPDLTNYTFTVSLSNPSDQTITVDYVTANDTAVAPSDYTAVTTTTLTFNPGETSKPVTVTVKGDTTYELNERFFVNLSNVNANATILDGQGDGTITNDDAAPTFSINDRSNNEGTMPTPLPSPTPQQFTTQTFTVTKTGSTAVTATVTFATADGSATGDTAPCPSGFDYQTQTGSLSFLANETTKTITVPVCKDPDFEANETFFVNLSAPTHATFTDDQGQGTILNDDIPSTGFVVNTTDDLDDTVCNGVHCSLREAIIAANGSSTAVAISFNIPADDHFNLAGPRHFYYQDDNAGGGANGTLGNVATTTQPNDSANLDRDPDWPNSWWSILPTSQLPATTKQVFINGDSQAGAAFNTLTTGTNAILRIELNGTSAGLNATGLTISGGTSTVRGLVINRFQRDGSAPTPTGNGLSLPSGSNTISGDFIGTDVSGTLDVGSLAGLVTGSGISITSFNNVIGGATPDVINLISGNDRDGISFSNSNTNVIQGNLIGTKANGTSALGNGASGLSFTGLGSVANTIGGPDTGQANTIAFNSGDGVSLSTANFGNSIRGNSIFSNGTTNLHLGIDLGADGVTPNDNLDTDTGPNNLQNFPIITATMVTGSTRTITGTLNSTAGAAFVIDFYQSPACDTVGGNGEGKTYLGSTDPPVTTDGTTGNVTFTFHPSVLTVGQFVTATATSTGAGFDTSEFSACTQVLDGSSGAGDIQFTSATYTVGEAGGTASITVQRVGGTNGSITSTFSTSNGTAQAPDDYTAVSSLPITYIEGETGTKTVTVSIVNDTVFEGNETVNLSLSHPRVINATEPDDGVALVADPYSAVLTITENDPAPTFTIDDVTHAEGNSGTTSYVFTVTKAGSTALNAGVSFQTQNSTATTADNDYQTSSGTLSFLPSDTTKTITVLVNGDTTVELPSPETFFVNLTSPTNATIADSQGVGTITNDDTDVTVAVAPASVSEDGVANLVYTFTRAGVTTGALTINFSVGGTAAFSTDYAQTGAASFSASSGTVTFGAGNSTAPVTIDPTPDISFESNETVVLTVTAGTGYNVGSPSAATGTINNDDAAGGIIQFTSNTYITTENSRLVTITVERLGSTSGAVTANYATPDDSEALTVTSCSTNNTGFASPRCDFTTALGTIRFADGDSTPKTFDILISQDSYVEPPENLTVTLSNLTGAAVFGVNTVATVRIDDDDLSAPVSNPIDDPQNFVRQHYHDFLNREPDAGGLAFWTNEITSCGSNQQCIDFKRVQVSAAFYLSIEFQDTGYLVERLYKAAYGDGTGSSTFGVNPQPHQLAVPIVRFTEFLGDTQEIGQGVVVGAPGWPQALENNKVAFADRFAQRARFVAALPSSMTPAQFVDKLNLNAGNPLSQAERDQLVADLTSNAKTRAQVLRGVAEDQDLKNSEFNRAFVLMQYFGYLRRNPNVAPDADYSGYDFWLTKLNQFNGNFQNADMVKAFITSSEYRSRSGP